MRITNRHKFFDTLLLFTLVMSGGGIFFVLQRNILSYFLLFLALFSLLFNGGKIKKSIMNASFFSLVSFSLLLLINYLIAPKIEFMQNTSINYLQYAFHMLNITSCVLILMHFTNNRDYTYFLDRIYFVLKLVLYHALISSIIYFFFKGYLVKIYGGWSNEYVADSLWYLFFYDPEKYEFSLFGVNLIRNQGWFWEPGVLQVFLNILLFLEGLVIKKSKKIIFLLVITIISTYSTTGIFIMIMLLFFIFWSYIKRNPLIIFLAVASILPLYYIAESNLENKTIGEKSSSFQKRYLDLVQPVAIASDYPMTGIGLDRAYFHELRSKFQMKDNFGKIIETSTGYERIAESTEKGSSNSLTYLIAAMGFPGALLLFLCLFKQQVFIQRKNIFMGIVVISVFSSPLLLRPFFLLLIVSGMFSIFKR